MKKNLLLLLCLSVMIFSCGSLSKSAAQKKKKGEVAKTDTVKPKKKETPYEKIVKGKSTIAQKSNFISVYKVGSEVYLEIPKKYMGKEMLFASTITATSNPNTVSVGYKPSTPLHVKFEIADSSVVLVNCATYTELENNIKESMSKNYMDSRIGKYKFEAISPDSSSVLFKATTLFTDKGPLPSPIQGRLGSMTLISSAKTDLMTLGKIKSFDDNISVETQEVYAVSATQLFFKFDLGNVSVNTTKSFLLLPENKMKPRISDPRVGIFLTGKQKISPKEGSTYFSYFNRWRLEPKDSTAWAKGELVEPVKPILFYLDTDFPEDWKPSIRKGVLTWNDAFEKIGFKNAVQIRDFPKDDPNFDPDNLKYSCIRYSPTATANAMGPSWVDPTTGEIINASVIVYNDIAKLIYNWRFVQTAQVDEAVRAYDKMPKEKFDEALVYVIAHEVGHTLGYMHNMSASAAFPVDSLRNAAFTQKYGTTPSIMDYARFNYIAQPGDKVVRLMPPSLGQYDYYAIKCNYAPISGNKTVKEEAKIVEKWIDEKVGNPIYRYGQQQMAQNYDPTALTEDLGDNPIKAGNYGIKNLKYNLSNLDKWIKDDDYAEKKQEVYMQVMMQYHRYINNVLCQVGGVKLNTVREGTNGKTYEPLSAQVQKASIKWVLNELQNSEWLDNKKISKDLFGVKYNYVLQFVTMNALFSNFDKITLAAHLTDKNPYTQKDYFNDLYEAIWAPTIKGKKLNDNEKMLQRLYFMSSSGIVNSYLNPKSIADDFYFAFDPANVFSVDEIIRYNLDPTGFVRRYRDQLTQIEKEKGKGMVAMSLLPAEISAKNDPYNFQRAVPVGPLSETAVYFTESLDRLQKLLQSRVNSAHPDDRAHYKAMLMKINNLKNGNQ